MQTEQLNIKKEDISEVGIFKREGDFKNEQGNNVHFVTYTLAMKIGEYPVEFKFKGDKIVNEYIKEALEYVTKR